MMFVVVVLVGIESGEGVVVGYVGLFGVVVPSPTGGVGVVGVDDDDDDEGVVEDEYEVVVVGLAGGTVEDVEDMLSVDEAELDEEEGEPEEGDAGEVVGGVVSGGRAGDDIATSKRWKDKIRQ
jgi:hypothetical protein